MKRITVIASGTRGDVQPAIAFSKGLVRKGHEVAMLAGANFRPWIEKHGLNALPAQVDMQELMESEGGREWVERGHNPLVQKRLMLKLVDRYGARMTEDVWQACQGADAVVTSFTSDTYVTAIAEKLAIPQVSMPLQPALFATHDGRSVPSAPLPHRRSILNYWFSKLLIEPFPWQIYGAITARLRRELGLPPQSARENLEARKRLLTLQAYSSSVVPHPTDFPPNVHTTGYWFLDEPGEGGGWQPPSDLLAFLEAGSPPVYVGFGSMAGRKGEETKRLVVDGLLRSGQRGIVVAAGLERNGTPDTIFAVENVAHSWLFPRMAAVVHHGGAGTTSAGLRAGVPSLVIPHIADQPFWGQRVQALGVGPRPIPRHRLTVERLADGITAAVSDAGMRQRAAALGETIRSEDGLAHAMELFPF